jgi:phenylpyruvate tautomerase PptA (4-oxalocrotonate tautomerase family)
MPHINIKLLETKEKEKPKKAEKLNITHIKMKVGVRILVKQNEG